LSRTHCPSTVARLATDAATAGKISNAITATFDTDSVATSVFEEPDGRSSIELHFRVPPDEVAIRELIAATGCAQAAAALKFETLAVVDWVRQGLAALPPVKAGRFTVHGAHDRARVAANCIAIEIEAALAFGTGHHGTTRGCLIALDRMVKRERGRRRPVPPSRIAFAAPNRSTRRSARPQTRQRRVDSSAAAILDVGTGTGVLAIAAAKALRRQVLASDIDPRAVAVARANARLNRAARHIEVIRAAGVSTQRFCRRGRYRLILANILLEPLQRLATPMGRLLAPQGELVLSGLLAGQATAALASYRARGLALAHRIRLEGWMTLVLRRP
jgi:ribosomal protein L11 methyltransferase